MVCYNTQMMKMKTVKTITLPLENLDRSDGITSFSEEFEQHPGRKMFKEYIQAYAYLDPIEQAQHKLADSPTWRNYSDAMRLGVQIYNHRTNGGLEPPPGT